MIHGYISLSGLNSFLIEQNFANSAHPNGYCKWISLRFKFCHHRRNYLSSMMTLIESRSRNSQKECIFLRNQYKKDHRQEILQVRTVLNKYNHLKYHKLRNSMKESPP